ncbi:D-arabinono-1,4-lactone oxidase [Tenacibaculum caenipelagi]|uniref:FAD-linked oxidoreductase n=1 Tax=Tenacibaculum caenipelagi TaxID=1325435 RepID=A0A4R6THK2_9FLAO|nr:D-arabinono-1,4-lactone oxidase [Tenacibaculum caenipelagi]TDQ28656.1 FAD-linked oxidoreductase [Tenacibaculum caenipelagi]
MKNWAENVQWNPSAVAFPHSENEIQQLVLKAIRFNQKIRVIGSGHSFTSLCSTDEILVTLDNFQGLISIDKEKNQATVKAGTKLSLLGELLFKEGLAMENMGDINVQSIAGAISTGTHGTGINLKSISNQVIGLKFVNGKGEIIECSTTKNTELFKAAQVSLGCLGIITEITLQCVPTYKLKLQNKKEKLSDVLATLDERNSQNRNFEFYWIPYTNTAWTKTSNIVEDSEPDKVNFFNYWTEYVLENYVFKLMCEYARVLPSQNKTVANITAASISNVKKVYHSHKVYATQRMVKFHEMEYNVPVETYQDVFKDVQKIVNSKKFNIHFPIENRWVKGDDVYMSPAYNRDSAYIACHVYNKKDSSAYFTALEEIFKAYDGRPHWGKINTFTTDDIVRMYPKFADFLTFRKEHDPENIFVNPYLQKLLGI